MMYGLYERKHTTLKETNDSLAWKIEDHDDDDDDGDDDRIFDNIFVLGQEFSVEKFQEISFEKWQRIRKQKRIKREGEKETK